MTRSAVPRIDHVIIQPTPFCNIDCHYCYLPNRSSKAVMSQETAAAVFRELFASGWCNGGLNIIWHAGEPLVLSPSYYREMHDLIRGLAPPGSTIKHNINTNATLIDDEWCTLFRDLNFGLGISIDGPKFLHDANRRTRSGRGTFDATLAGIRKLQAHAIPFYVITVLSAESLKHADALFDFYVSENIHRVCFNIEEVEGIHRASSLSGDAAVVAADKFFRQFWNRLAQQGNKLWVREFHSMFRAALSLNPNPIRPLTDPFVHLNVDWMGRMSTFSPELLAQKSDKYGDFILGDLRRDSLAVVAASEKLKRLQGEIDEGTALCRETCSYFGVCGGGAPSNKFAEHGTFAVSETLYCRINVKVLAEIAVEALERISQDAGAGAPVLYQAEAAAGNLISS